MVIRLVAALAALALVGCGTVPARPMTQAEVQALVDCRVRADQLPSNAISNPILAGAMQEQFITDCMAAKGYVY